MSWLSDLWGWFGGIVEAPPTPIGDLGRFESWADGQADPAASRADLAVRVHTVHACWKVLSESVAGLPCKLYRRDGRIRKELQDDPRNRFFGWSPGPDATSFDVFEWTVVSMLATGKAAWQKVFSQTGDLLEVVPLDVTRLKPPVKRDGDWIYRIARARPRRSSATSSGSATTGWASPRSP